VINDNAEFPECAFGSSEGSEARDECRLNSSICGSPVAEPADIMHGSHAGAGARVVTAQVLG